MRAWKTKLIAPICAATLAIAANLPAQTAVPDSQSKQLGQALSPNQNRSPGVYSDATLEIAPHASPTPPMETSPASVPNDSDDLSSPPQQELPPVPTSGPPSSMVSNGSQSPLPYLGVSVQRIESHSTPGHDIDGLEIISVDADSPAERAGLKGRGGMTRLGASGATAGALMAPLDIALMPLLKKTGQLGQTGDLIVAIDDRRVAGEADLETALSDSKPGDTIYLTVVRLNRNGVHKTIKIPVKLGSPAPIP
ncbi:MAG: PDZ domain-containing protein [Deltaproteobacteria bacterium]|nr:PDZ domain-containing protein [Deltaproteobacteria bacterium]